MDHRAVINIVPCHAIIKTIWHYEEVLIRWQPDRREQATTERCPQPQPVSRMRDVISEVDGGTMLDAESELLEETQPAHGGNRR
jgi:hypothetical protein